MNAVQDVGASCYFYRCVECGLALERDVGNLTVLRHPENAEKLSGFLGWIVEPTEPKPCIYAGKQFRTPTVTLEEIP